MRHKRRHVPTPDDRFLGMRHVRAQDIRDMNVSEDKKQDELRIAIIIQQSMSSPPRSPRSLHAELALCPKRSLKGKSNAEQKAIKHSNLIRGCQKMETVFERLDAEKSQRDLDDVEKKRVYDLYMSECASKYNESEPAGNGISSKKIEQRKKKTYCGQLPPFEQCNEAQKKKYRCRMAYPLMKSGMAHNKAWAKTFAKYPRSDEAALPPFNQCSDQQKWVWRWTIYGPLIDSGMDEGTAWAKAFETYPLED